MRRAAPGPSSSSASSKAPKIRPRTSSASSIVFMPGAWTAELVVAEVRLRRAGGDDQAVVGELPASGRAACTRRCGARGRRRRPRRARPRALRWWRRTSRSGGATFPSRQDAGRDLVEQRLEEVVRLPVDHRHVDAAPGAAPSRRRGRRSRRRRSRPDAASRPAHRRRRARASTCRVAGAADHAEPAAAHPEPPLVDGRRRLDLEPVADRAPRSRRTRAARPSLPPRGRPRRAGSRRRRGRRGST